MNNLNAEEIIAVEYKALGLDDDFNSSMWIKAETRVEKFLSLYSKKTYFDKIIIFRNKFLTNHKEFNFDRGIKFIEICSRDQALPMHNALLRSCISHGHLSIIFIVSRKSIFFDEYLKLKLYLKNKSFNILALSSDQPIKKEDIRKFAEIMDRFKVGQEKIAITFSHDADYLYFIGR